MNSEKNSKDINNKSIRETKEEINKILQKLENENSADVIFKKIISLKK